jgi:hypothetical protein
MSPGRAGGSVPFASKSSTPQNLAPVLAITNITDVVYLSGSIPSGGLPCIAPTGSNWQLYFSSYYIDTPDLDPDHWSGPLEPDGDGPTSANWDELPLDNYFIARVQTSAGFSPWSHIAPANINVVFTEGDGVINFAWSGPNPASWRLYYAANEAAIVNANVTNVGDSDDGDLTADATARSIDVSELGEQFYFILVACAYQAGCDVEAARGVYG